MSKLIYILIDGLSFDVAKAHMGYLQHLVESGQAGFFQVMAELPTISRPLYEVLMTGTPCSVNGIVNNQISRRSHQKSVFELAREAGLSTAAAAYHWISELYNKAPFDPIEDRDCSDEALNIQHGRFYFEDEYPDSHLFLDGNMLIRVFRPDFALIHPMGVDHAGHLHGGCSKEYCVKAAETDGLLSTYLPLWMSAGYTILVTADHGMNEMGFHGGSAELERLVPLWILGCEMKFSHPETCVPQLELASFVCELLEIKPFAAMAGHRFKMDPVHV